MLFIGLSKKALKFDNKIVGNSLKRYDVCKFIGCSSKFTKESPIWNNHNIIYNLVKSPLSLSRGLIKVYLFWVIFLIIKA